MLESMTNIYYQMQIIDLREMSLGLMRMSTLLEIEMKVMEVKISKILEFIAHQSEELLNLTLNRIIILEFMISSSDQMDTRFQVEIEDHEELFLEEEFRNSIISNLLSILNDMEIWRE